MGCILSKRKDILRKNMRMCQYGNCENKVMVGKISCDAHTCPVTNCDEPMVFSTSFCNFHQYKRRS